MKNKLIGENVIYDDYKKHLKIREKLKLTPAEKVTLTSIKEHLKIVQQKRDYGKKIIISAHLDRVIQDFSLSYDKGIHKGLLDNFIGVLLSYLVLYDDKNLIELEKEGKIQLWHNQGEEWGLLQNPPKSNKKDIILVVDVASNKRYNNIDFSLENISGFKKKEIKEIKDFMKREGFKLKTKEYDGNKDDEDEAWSWRKRGNKVISFILPINCIDDSWHRIQQDCTVDYTKIENCKQGLKRLINYFLS